MRDCKRVSRLAALLVMGTAVAAYAEMAISSNDTKVKLVNGKQEVQKSPPPDNLTFIDLKSTPPKVLAELDVPNSLVGPPTNVAISPKEDIALIASAMMIDPADPTKQIPDDRLTVIDLSPLKPSSRRPTAKSVVGAKAGPTAPKVIATLQAGKGASGVSINKAGTLALVANNAEGTVSVFTISGTTVASAGKVEVGKPDSGPRHVVFTPDGKRALVTRDNDNRVAVLSVDGSKVEATKREIASGLRPNAIDVAATGDVAVVANVGISGSGDASYHQRHRSQARSAAGGQQRFRRRDARGHEDLARRQVRRRHRHERHQSRRRARRSTTTTACCRCGPAPARS